MPSSPAASVVVPNYNGSAHLPALLAALANQSTQDFELLVIDNGSTDDSEPTLAGAANRMPYPIRVIPNLRNLGFGPATNLGIRRSVAPWIATLNNDALPSPRWLENMLNTANSTHSSERPIGMIAALLLRAQNPGQIDSAGIALDWSGIAWDWRGGQYDDYGESSPQPVFGPCAGAALYSREMLREIGLFDEDFFAYMEDVDLAWRARLAGWKAVLQPRAKVLHAHSATLGDASPRKRYLLARNKIWLLVKNYPSQELSRRMPSILTYDGLAALYGIVTRSDFASLRGRTAALRRLPTFLEKRRRIQTRWQDVDNWRQAVSPLEAPWEVSRRYAHLRVTPGRPSKHDGQRQA
jgi:GT2 family glycosyltransferase